jgi:hypothetical protein
MKFSLKGPALACGILWGVAMLGMGLANLILLRLDTYIHVSREEKPPAHRIWRAMGRVQIPCSCRSSGLALIGKQNLGNMPRNSLAYGGWCHLYPTRAY